MFKIVAALSIDGGKVVRLKQGDFSKQLRYDYSPLDVARLFRNENIPLAMLVWGSLGQVIFTFRFVYQWIYSENRKESNLPVGFWIMSLMGSLMILSYAVYRKDPVLFLGQSFGFIVYSRNIVLGIKGKKPVLR